MGRTMNNEQSRDRGIIRTMNNSEKGIHNPDKISGESDR